MFYYLEGTVSVLDTNMAVIDVGGVGYLCYTTMNTISRLEVGKRAKLYTYCHIKEDAFDLYGFNDLNEKRSFEMLLSVSGVGPKGALAILSSTTPEGFAMAIVSENEKVLTAAPGIGKRIAQRVILELKDKISKETAAVSPGGMQVQSPGLPGSKLADITAALTVLGYAPAEINAALKGISIDEFSVEDCVKLVLKNSLK
ncbi:MAG: Holliday junction branch migration protein RuvA [Oscillospiraceae bacterium]|nr:Holliday junction branch migration protein RuvA [Oscillospiraceae bacterium]